MTNFLPTHEITLTDRTDGERHTIEVCLVDGAAYTREEWEAGVKADWTCDNPKGSYYGVDWNFQGHPAPTNRHTVSVRKVWYT